MIPTPVQNRPPGRTDNLALIFQEVFTAVVRLRANRQELTDAESFRYHMREAIRTAVQEAKAQGYSADDLKMATLALVGFLDESVLNTHDPLFADWPRKPLQEELFGIHMAGELFFRNLEQLSGRPDSADLADLLEVHYLCLLLGYGGRYSVGGRSELQAITNGAGDRIRRIRGLSTEPFSIVPAEAPPMRQRSNPWVKRLTIAAVVCCGLMLVLFAAFKVSLGSAASEIRAAGAQMKG